MRQHVHFFISILICINILSLYLYAQDSDKENQPKYPEININGYTQMHWMYYGKSGQIPNNALFLRRARFSVKPIINPSLESVLEVDLGRSKVSIKDAYIQYSFFKSLKFVLGHHKMPFSREALTSASKILFIERTEVDDKFGDNLWSGRDIGISVKGNILKNQQIDLDYHVGIYNGNAGNPEYNNAKQFAERIRCDIGKAFSLGINSSQRTDSITAKTMLAHGIDASYSINGFVFEGEILYGQRTPDKWMLGWYGQAYYEISGIELGIRYEKLRKDYKISLSENRTTFETGYIFNKYFRIRANLDYIQPEKVKSYYNFITQVQARF